jgi:hypothetical protein
MIDKEPARLGWDTWERHAAGDASEDLAQVLHHVRPGDDEGVRAAWARDPRTRIFCDLALHLLYQSTIAREDGRPIRCDQSPCAFANGRDLERHASTVIREPALAATLTEHRWSETWPTRDEFMQDCFAYLFRPGPYLRRVRDVQSNLINMMKSGMALGALIREAVGLEIKSNLTDPLAALQTAVEAAFPKHPEIRQHLLRMDGSPLRLWARLYAVVFPAYGLDLRRGKSWFDVAYIYTTVADGALLRTRARDESELLSSGEDVLSAVILGMLPDLFQTERGVAEGLLPVTMPDDSFDWLDQHVWEDEES